MEVINARCAGLDVHKRQVVACIRVPGHSRKTRGLVKTFGTTTPELLSLVTWLTDHQIGKVAMESTGVYWRPVYHVLEGSVEEILLVNAQHVKAVPGNIELGSVATDIMGKSGRAMIQALIGGESDPQQLADLSWGNASIGKGNNWVKSTLVEAAWAASRTKRSYYSALFKRIRARGGPRKAVTAVAHSMLEACWHILRSDSQHCDLGSDFYERLDRDRLRRHHIKRLKDLGFNVTIEEAA